MQGRHSQQLEHGQIQSGVRNYTSEEWLQMWKCRLCVEVKLEDDFEELENVEILTLC